MNNVCPLIQGKTNIFVFIYAIIVWSRNDNEIGTKGLLPCSFLGRFVSFCHDTGENFFLLLFKSFDAAHVQ